MLEFFALLAIMGAGSAVVFYSRQSYGSAVITAWASELPAAALTGTAFHYGHASVGVPAGLFLLVLIGFTIASFMAMIAAAASPAAPPSVDSPPTSPLNDYTLLV